MPRKPNYGLNKHRKEQDRKAKKEAKLMQRQQRRSEQSGPEDADASQPPTEEGSTERNPD